MRISILIILVLLSGNALSKDKKKLSKQFQDTLTMIIEDVESVIDPNWFVVRNDSGFTVYYCRTCQEAYEYYNEHWFDKSDSLYPLYDGFPSRGGFLTHYEPDSIHFMNTVSIVRNDYHGQKSFAEKYPLNGILKFDVYFQPQWNKAKIDEIQAINDSIKKCILENHSKVVYTSFYDYRYFIYTCYQDCYYEGINSMQRLPYQSLWYNYAIFIARNPDQINKRPYFTDSDHSEKTNLDALLDRTLKSVAFTLGVNDFMTLYEHHRARQEQSKNRFNKFD